jgi:hypothetical protein
MFRSALPRCVAVLTLVLCLSSLAPAWASGKTGPLPVRTPAPAAAQHAGALTTLWNWLQALVGKPAGQSGGTHLVIDIGACNDPNGNCHG